MDYDVMKAIRQLSLNQKPRSPGMIMVALIACLAGNLVSSHAAQSSPQPLAAPSGEPGWPRGDAYDVQVAGDFAYVALGPGGLAIFDVGNPARCHS